MTPAPGGTAGALPDEEPERGPGREEPERVDETLRTIVERTETATTLTVAGEIDTYSAPVFAHLVVEVLAAGLPVTIDLRGVTFIDSAGIRSLTGLAFDAQLDARPVRILASAVVARVAELAGLAPYLPIVETGNEI